MTIKSIKLLTIAYSPISLKIKINNSHMYWYNASIYQNVFVQEKLLNMWTKTDDVVEAKDLKNCSLD